MKKEDVLLRLTPALYVLKSMGGTATRFTLSKLLYFADQKHLVAYGRTFTGDKYCALPNGPVPSEIYDLIKIAADETKFYVDEEIKDFVKTLIAVNGENVRVLAEPDLDFVSKSAIRFISESVKEHGGKRFYQLVRDSHDNAWAEARKISTKNNNQIDFVMIAKAGGASEGMLKYISEE